MAKYDDKGNINRSKLKGYVSASPDDKYRVTEAFKGEVVDVLIKFPRELGVEHPFNFEDVEKTYKRVGLLGGAVNKITDAIVGDFTIKCNKDKVKKVLDEFTKKTDFATVLREWIREGFIKGNGFMELDLENQKIRVLNANNIYVKRDRKGKVKEYKQWVGDFKRFDKASTKLITFKPTQIAHLRINKIADEAYGIGIIWPNERVIENLVLNEEALHKLISRKAGAPIHAKVGIPGEAVRAADVDDFKDKLQYLTNSTEWVTDGNVEMKVVDFGDVGKNLTDTLTYDMQNLAYGFEIPIVLFGAGNIPEGLAKVQLEAFQRKIASVQEEIESMIEEQIFMPLLEKQGLKGEPEFIWNLPGEAEINSRIEKLTKLIENFNVSEPLRRMCELEVARLLDLEDAPKFLAKPEKEKEEEEPMPGQPPPGQPPQPQPGQPPPPRPGQPPPPPKTKQALESERAMSGDMTLREFANITMLDGNYSEYLVYILRRLRVDSFEELRGLTPAQIANGSLSKTDVEKLRVVLKEGFRKDRTIGWLAAEIAISIKLKDVLKRGKVIVKAELRPDMIARTETVRLSNLGAIDSFKARDYTKVRWITVLSGGTCAVCEALDGQVFEINTVTQPPVHTNCRCRLWPIE